MPTSDERREVAARLRAYIVYAKAHDKNGDCTMGSDKCVDTRCTLYNDIASCIEECVNFNLSAEQVFTRLADLIDPTCHAVPSDGGFFTCSECGERIGAVLPTLGTVLMHHCSHCGARVVKEGER
jgi:hypothetical protein